MFSFLFFGNLSIGSETPMVSVRIGKSLKSILVTGLDLKRHLIFNNDVRIYSGKKQ
jgi:hypothetical protein